MKKFLITIIATGIAITSHAQKLSVTPVSAQLNKSTNAGIEVEIPDADRKDVEKKWISHLKSFDGKINTTKGEIHLDNGKIYTISPDTLDIYSSVKDKGDNVILTVSINKNGRFVEPSMGTEYMAMEKMIRDFAVSMRKNAIQDRVKDASKEYDNLVKKQESRAKKREDLIRDNENMKNKIRDNERTISDIIKEEKDKASELEDHKKQIEMLQNSVNSVE
jgi:hypothetical protein